MIGDAVLFEIIGANLLRAIAACRPASGAGRNAVLLLLAFDFEQPRSQDAHGLFAVLDLRFFVLHRDHGVCGQVGDAHGGVGRVDRLASGPEEQNVSTRMSFGSIFVDLLGFGKDGNRDRRGVDAPAGLGLRHALHAVHRPCFRRE